MQSCNSFDFKYGSYGAPSIHESVPLKIIHASTEYGLTIVESGYSDNKTNDCIRLVSGCFSKSDIVCAGS